MSSDSTRETQLFEIFCEQARKLETRQEIDLVEVPAPQRLAPFAIAFSVDVGEEDVDIATGRFVMLHDPAGQEAWDGRFRAVTFIRSAIEDEMQADPLLTDVAWTWVGESLQASDAKFTAESGTVTRVSSASYGQLAEKDISSEIEIRASWTPKDSAKLIEHIHGWIKLVEMVSGLTPLVEGVSAIKSRR